MEIQTRLSEQIARYLDLTTNEAKLTAANMANIDTPGYRTLGIHFEAEMRGALTAVDRGSSPIPARVLQVDGLIARPDGNNVSMDRESLESGRGAIEIQNGSGTPSRRVSTGHERNSRGQVGGSTEERAHDEPFWIDADFGFGNAGGTDARRSSGCEYGERRDNPHGSRGTISPADGRVCRESKPGRVSKSPAWHDSGTRSGRKRRQFPRLVRNSIAPGVHIAGVVEDTAAPLERYDPGHPDAGPDGYVAYPDINPLTEMVDLMGASRAYGLNGSAVQAEKGMITTALEIAKS